MKNRQTHTQIYKYVSDWIEEMCVCKTTAADKNEEELI